ncbi:SDR family oxidoreductase [Candidimonas sp. SYP-B2681]|nr:SDR family oxidoreductase [Candidimonas sp. SYP-B2681]
MDVWIQRPPLKRIGRLKEVANAVLWLSSTNTTFINGAVRNVDGGFLAC